VHGYLVAGVMSARDAINPLRSYGWFDCVESNGALKWPTRAKPAVKTLTADDLAAHPSGEQRPSSVDTTRAQEVELPRVLRVHYAQTDMNYEPGEQYASRQTAGDVEVRDLEVAVAMSHQKASQASPALTSIRSYPECSTTPGYTPSPPHGPARPKTRNRLAWRSWARPRSATIATPPS
jgi:hypothetical protein